MAFEDFFEDWERMQHQIERMFGYEQFPKMAALPSGKGNEIMPFRSPRTDIYETDKSVVARFELPGADKEDIQLNVSDRAIEVKVEKKAEKKEEKKGFYLYESRCQSFYRNMPLPKEVVSEKAEAKFSNGVLEVEIPKAHAELPAKKRIAIK